MIPGSMPSVKCIIIIWVLCMHAYGVGMGAYPYVWVFATSIHV